MKGVLKMGRPLEYRAFNLQTKQWEYFGLSRKGDMGIPLVCIGDGLWMHRTIPDQQYTALTEWTGLFDKHKVKIFEGDVIKATYDYDPWLGEVVYDESCAQYDLVEYSERRNSSQPLYQFGDYEVLGSRMDSPELLVVA